MTFGPLHHSSPGALTPDDGWSISSPVAGSMILHSMFGRVTPTVPSGMSSRSSGMVWLTGLISLIPYPCRTVQPSRVATACPSSCVQRCGTGEDDADRRRVVVVDDRVLGQRHRDRRRDVQIRGAVLRDDPQEFGQVELGHGDDRRLPVQGAVHQHVHAVDVEERQDGQDLVVPGHADHRPALGDVRDQVPVRQHHALGPPGGAGGIGEHGEMRCRVEVQLRSRGAAGHQRAQAGAVRRGRWASRRSARRSPAGCRPSRPRHRPGAGTSTR